MDNPEQVSCPLCGNDERELLMKAPDRFSSGMSADFLLQRCLSCGMTYLAPRPAEDAVGAYYEHEEYLPFSSTQESRSVTERAYRVGRRLNLRWKTRMIEQYWRRGTARGPGRLLDVGCGTGEFLATARKGGWVVEGLEKNENASSWARATWDIPVHTGDLRGLPETAGPFDVITMWHVLEHLYDPLEALSRLQRMLDKDGFLLIAVPNIQGVDSKVYGANWIALDAPRHVNHFSPETLTRMSIDSGLEPFVRRQLPFDAFFNTLMSEQLAAKRNRASMLIWPFRLVRAGVVSLFSLAGGSRIFSAGFGPTLVYLLRKA